MTRAATTLALVAGLLAAAPAIGRDTATRDVEGYAIASCLVAQKSRVLADQGDGWAANIVQRPTYDVALFGRLAQVVKSEVARGGMASIVVDSPPMTTKALPIQYCAELIDRPRVRRAIDATLTGLRARRRR